MDPFLSSQATSSIRPCMAPQSLQSPAIGWKLQGKVLVYFGGLLSRPNCISLTATNLGNQVPVCCCFRLWVAGTTCHCLGCWVWVKYIPVVRPLPASVGLGFSRCDHNLTWNLFEQCASHYALIYSPPGSQHNCVWPWRHSQSWQWWAINENRGTQAEIPDWEERGNTVAIGEGSQTTGKYQPSTEHPGGLCRPFWKWTFIWKWPHT